MEKEAMKQFAEGCHISRRWILENSRYKVDVLYGVGHMKYKFLEHLFVLGWPQPPTYQQKP